MNDVVTHGKNDTATDRQHDLAIHSEIEKLLKDRADAGSRWGMRLFAFAAFLALAGGLALGVSRVHSQHREVQATAQQHREFVPTVRVATVEASPGTIPISLPATTAAFADASIYARATGYIEKRNVDIGDHVKAGDLLAQLAVPELDHQIAQNEATLVQLRAALRQAQANLNLAEVTWHRDRPLVRDGWVTQQQGTVDVDTVTAQQAAVGVAEANVTAQENQLKMLRQQRDYASVVAAFDGVITQRNVDVGSLVQGNATTGTFMFEIMQTDVIRVFVYVPQDAAFGVAPGVDGIVRVPEMPGRPFPGKVTRIAEALESGSRTLLTEIDIPNPDGALQPGTYCTVELDIPRKTPSFLLPAEATIFNQKGLQVAVVEGGTVHTRSISVLHDSGTQVEVSEGVRRGEQVIINPPVNLVDGSEVRTRIEPAAPKLAAPAAPELTPTRAAAASNSVANTRISSARGHAGQRGGRVAGVAGSRPCVQDCKLPASESVGPGASPVAGAGRAVTDLSGSAGTAKSGLEPGLTDDHQLHVQDVPSSVRQGQLARDQREVDKVLDRVIRNICRGC